MRTIRTIIFHYFPIEKAQQGDAGSQMWLGCAYEQGWFGKTDFAEALKWFRKSAATGNADAQNELGRMYELDHECWPQLLAFPKATRRELIVVATMISRMVGTPAFSDRTEFSVCTGS